MSVELSPKKVAKCFEDIFAVAAELGAEDMEEVGGEVFIYTGLADLAKVKDGLVQAGIEISEAELIREPITTVPIDDQAKLSRIESFINSLEELDDVQKVYTNLG